MGAGFCTTGVLYCGRFVLLVSLGLGLGLALGLVLYRDERGPEWLGRHQDGRVNRSVTVDNLASFMRDGVNIVASEMATRYAVAPTTSERGDMHMSVIDVLTYPEYAAIARWLEDLELIEEVVIEQVLKDRVLFRLRAQTDAAQLSSIIELNEHLVLIPTVDLDAVLSYRWQR